MDPLTTACIRPVLLALPLELERRIRCRETRWMLLYSHGRLLISRISAADVVDTGIDLDLQSSQVLPNLE